MTRSLIVCLSLLLCVDFSTAAVKKVGQDRQQPNTVTSTVTETITTTAIFSTTITDACAVLVNVTADCRRRRGIAIDEPVIMMFDEGLDDVEEYFNPSQPHSVETTTLTSLPYQAESTPNDFGSSDVIESSISTVPTTNGDLSSFMLPRIYFSQIAELINGLVNGVVTETVTESETFTSSVVSATTSTATFFVSKCTPAPFPYPIC